MSVEALNVKNLYVNYSGITVLENICFSIQEKEFVGIIGPNGGGKTTLLKAILGLIDVASGEIRIFGDASSRSKAFVGYVPQHTDLDRTFPISVSEAVLTGMLKGRFHPFFKYSHEQKQKAEQLLEKVGILQLAKKQISELSGGEFQRMLIARALACDPKILFLDEPTSNVDPASREQLYELFCELNKAITIVLVTHDLMAISSNIGSIACLNKTLVYHGEPSLTDDIINKLYGCPVELIAHGVPHRVLGDHTDCGGNCQC